MILHTVSQGSPEWHALRAEHFTASDAPAMLGLSKYKTRSQLLREKATGIKPEVSESMQRIFNAGHEVEERARPLAEEVCGVELYPATGSLEVDGLKLLASFDGISDDDCILFECKSWNAEYAAQVMDGVVPDTHWPQLEHQLLVSGGEKVYFTVTDGKEKLASLWYESQPERRASLIAGWKQFKSDLEAYQPEIVNTEVIAESIESLPAIFIQVEGKIVAGDMRAHRAQIATWVDKLPKTFESDQDFANGILAVKKCAETEESLKSLIAQIRGQMVSVDEVMRLIEDAISEVSAARLRIKKAVDIEKDKRKEEIVLNARREIQQYVDKLNDSLGIVIVPQPSGAMFATAIKGMSKLDLMRDKLAATLANAKVECDMIATTVRANLSTYAAVVDGHEFLFRDLHDLLSNPSPEGFAAIIQQRIDRHKSEQSAKMEAERERIRAEEQAKAEREAQAKAAVELEAELAKLRAEAEAKAGAEQDARNAETARQRLIGQDQRGKVDDTPIIPFGGHSMAFTSTPPDNGKTMRLGEICARLEFNVTTVFLAKLGFEPVGVDRAAKLYRECDFPAICNALISHIKKMMMP